MAFVCNKCNKVFTYKCDLKRHEYSGTCTKVVDLSCHECGKVFKRSFHLKRHIQSAKKTGSCAQSLPCQLCGRVFSRRHTLKLHLQTAHLGTLFSCGLCPRMFTDKQSVIAHRRQEHQQRNAFVLLQSAHDKACQQYRLNLPESLRTDINDTIDHCIGKSVTLLDYLLADKKFMKVTFTLSLRFSQPQFGAGLEEEDAIRREGKESIQMNFRSDTSQFTLHAWQANEDTLVKMFQTIAGKVDQFVHYGSGWIISDALYLDVEVGECLPLAGSCSLHKVRRKKQKLETYDVHPQLDEKEEEEEQEDHQCFWHAIAAHFLSKKEPSVEELESFVKDNIIVTVKSPVEVDKIKKVEADNAHLDMAINVVFRSEDGEVFPCYSSRNLDASEVIVLMLYYTQPKQSDGEEGILHYALITDPGLLLARRTKSKKGVHQSRRKHI